MAEQIKIASLQIDDKLLLTSLEETKEAIKAVTTEQKHLVKTGQDTSKQFVQNEANLKTLRGEYSAGLKVLQAVTVSQRKHTEALAKEVKTIDDAVKNNKDLRQVRNQLDASTVKGAKAIAEINKKLDQNNQFIKDNTSALEKQKQNIGNYASALGKARLASIAFGTALKAAGIGLVVAAVAKLTEAFNRNERVVAAVAKVTGAIGIVFDKVVSTIVDTVKAVNEATGGFDALGRVASSSVTLGLTPLKLVFYGIKLAIQEGQLAWEKSFFGGKDIDTITELTMAVGETKKAITEVAEAAVDAGSTYISNIGEAFAEVGTLVSATVTNVSKAINEIDMSKVFADAGAAAEFAKNYDVIIAKQEQIVKQGESQIETLKGIRDNDTLTTEQRLKAAQDIEAALISQEIAEKNLIRTKIANAQLQLKNNADNGDAQAELIRLQGELADAEKRTQTVRNENAAANRTINTAAIKEEQEKNAKLVEIREAVLLTEEEAAVAKIKRQEEAQILALETLGLHETEKALLKAAIEADSAKTIAEIRHKAALEFIKIDDKVIKQEQKASKLRASVAGGLASFMNGLLGDSISAKIAAVAIDAAIQAGMVKIDAAKAIGQVTASVGAANAGALATPAAIASFGLSAAPVIAANIAAGGVQTAAITAGAAASIGGILGSAAIQAGGSLISGITKKTFARGGVLEGASHAQGGIPTPFGELEGGEAVINTTSTAAFRPLLSAINEAGGGRKFANGGVLGDAIPSNSSLFTDQIVESLRQMPSPVVSVEEINRVGSRQVNVEAGGTF